MAKKTAKKRPTPKASKSFEESLWDTATKLRGSVEKTPHSMPSILSTRLLL